MKNIKATKIRMDLIDPDVIEESNIREDQKEKSKEEYKSDIENIKHTIKPVGHLQPILIRELTVAERGKSTKKTAIYGIINGNTRYATNSKKDIFATIVELNDTDDDQKKLALIANFAKSEMTTEDKAAIIYHEQERLKNLSKESIVAGNKKISASLETLARTFGISKAYAQKLVNIYKRNMKLAADNNAANLEPEIIDFAHQYKSIMTDIQNSMKIIIEDTDANKALDSIQKAKKLTKKIMEYLKYIEKNKPEIKAAKNRRAEIVKVLKDIGNKNKKTEKIDLKIEKLKGKIDSETKYKVKNDLEKKISEKQKEYNHLKNELEKLKQIIDPADEGTRQKAE
ncbi:ParB N-terminal domain-containing protein [Propionispira raffinosivorans]|uniref:ParB N-terminal domain-containing protein n=1 Tax=Propionispira raffinosivorans TaxID=86959 RepID=UPI00037F5550|nr:ParB N-terminal domain-containing protein [Propionispira raffinosivorans]